MESKSLNDVFDLMQQLEHCREFAWQQRHYKLEIYGDGSGAIFHGFSYDIEDGCWNSFNEAVVVLTKLLKERRDDTI